MKQARNNLRGKCAEKQGKTTNKHEKHRKPRNEGAYFLSTLFCDFLVYIIRIQRLIPGHFSENFWQNFGNVWELFWQLFGTFWVLV